MGYGNSPNSDPRAPKSGPGFTHWATALGPWGWTHEWAACCLWCESRSFKITFQDPKNPHSVTNLKITCGWSRPPHLGAQMSALPRTKMARCCLRDTRLCLLRCACWNHGLCLLSVCLLVCYPNMPLHGTEAPRQISAVSPWSSMEVAKNPFSQRRMGN